MIFYNRNDRILGSTQLQRVKDAKRLAETKLQGLEENLVQLQAQQQWLRRYNEISIILKRERERLFELTKQKAVMAKEISMLERYDLFEGIHGVYQQLIVVNKQIDSDKRGLSLLKREADENRQLLVEQEKRLQQAGKQLDSATTNMLDTFDRICQAIRLDGEKEAMEAETAFLFDYNNIIREEMNALGSLIQDKEKTLAALRKKLEVLQTRRHSMEIHENMLQHGEAVLIGLSTMEERNKRRSELYQKQQQAIKRQDEENELLRKAFAQYQNLVSLIESTEAVLGMHRSYIQGQDGLMLQERALMLKGRRQMLLSALSLWKRITTGYESIEEKSQRVTTLRLYIQHQTNGINQLETEAGKIQRLCKEKEYTYLLSKGQDIIQLRADLKEGISCTVCGATHHPYHSDTILDQSQLIREMKSDYELLASESNAKQQQLLQMQADLRSAQGRLEAEEEALNAIRIRQNEDVQEWKLYAQLDPTFSECSESTNLDARTATLRQFIENISRDAEVAEKELEAFTFHQSSVAKFGEELQNLEQKKNEVNVRLGELNTGCQVLSREVEQAGEQLENVTAQFTRAYENMQRTVTVKDWYAIWQKSPEQLYDQIQKLIANWSSDERGIAEGMATLDIETANIEGMKAQMQLLARYSMIIAKQTEDIDGRKAGNRKTYGQIVTENDVKTMYHANLQSIENARKQYEEERSRMESIRHTADIMQGRHDYYMNHIERLESEQKKLSERLDLWMHAFNQRHPPVQKSELDEVFADGKDWGQIRSNFKQINTDMLLCQAKVEDLNSRLIALDTEDGHCNATAPDIQESIAAKLQVVTQQRNDTMMQIARLAVQLEDHEKALADERNSAE